MKLFIKYGTEVETIHSVMVDLDNRYIYNLQIINLIMYIIIHIHDSQEKARRGI